MDILYIVGLVSIVIGILGYAFSIFNLRNKTVAPMIGEEEVTILNLKLDLRGIQQGYFYQDISILILLIGVLLVIWSFVF